MAHKEKTIEQKRGELLENRLNLLNDFIALNSEGGTDSFVKYLRQKGVKKEAFIDGLPTSLQSPPAGGIENIIDYAEAMNNHYFKQYLGYAKKIGISMDGVEGLVDYSGGDTPDGRLWGAGGGYLIYQSNDPGLSYSASAAERKARRKAARDARKKARQEASKDKGDKRALYALNKFNPVFVLSRNSYLALLKINLWGLATTLAKMKVDADQTDWRKVLTRWYNLGGLKDILSRNVDIGKNKPQLLRRKSKRADGTNYGMTEEAIVALITSASGVIITMVPLVVSFKKRKGLPEDDSDKEMNDPLPDPDDDPSKDDAPEGEGVGEGMSTKMKWIIGGSIGAVLLITGIIVVVKMRKK